MLVRPLLTLAAASTLLLGAVSPQQGPAPESPSYTPGHQLRFPARYREWVFLTSGMDMSYNPKAAASDHSMFDNVFVNPASYREFLNSGTWPDGTTFILENRGAVHGGDIGASINKHGLTQTEDVMGLEVHVKDASLPGGWGFFSFDEQRPDVPAKLTPRPASCYTCHEQHAAVDTTFVQFYPTLRPVAKTKGTLSKAYLAETAH